MSTAWISHVKLFSTTQLVIIITALPVAADSVVMKFTSIATFGENANTFGVIGNTPRVFKISFGVTTQAGIDK